MKESNVMNPVMVVTTAPTGGFAFPFNYVSHVPFSTDTIAKVTLTLNGITAPKRAEWPYVKFSVYSVEEGQVASSATYPILLANGADYATFEHTLTNCLAESQYEFRVTATDTEE
jgi:hypothetical protein